MQWPAEPVRDASAADQLQDGLLARQSGLGERLAAAVAMATARGRVTPETRK
jgi:hypothetical protein